MAGFLGLSNFPWAVNPGSHEFFGYKLRFLSHNFSNVGPYSFVMQYVMSGRLQKVFLILAFLICSSLTLFLLIPSIHLMAVWWKALRLLRLCFVKFHDSPPHNKAFIGPQMYRSAFVLRSMSFPLKKCFIAPRTFNAFMILVLISRSYMSVSEMIASKYLKLCANCIIFSPSLMRMLDGINLRFSAQSASSKFWILHFCY